MSRQPIATRSILVVDDHDSVAQLMAAVMHYEGYEVTVVRSEQAGLKLVADTAFDLVVLDFTLANLCGRGFSSRMCGNGTHVPLLYLASKDDARGRLSAAKIDIDDCLLRPFSVMELVGRIKAILHCHADDDLRIRFADLIVNEGSHEVWRAGRPVHLSGTEFDLLRLFLLNPRQVLSKNRIVDHAWHYNFAGSRDIVETYVFYLRRKLDACGPPLIHTFRHVGYILREAS
jgi:two-component system OmpR family response regulator